MLLNYSPRTAIKHASGLQDSCLIPAKNNNVFIKGRKKNEHLYLSIADSHHSAPPVLCHCSTKALLVARVIKGMCSVLYIFIYLYLYNIFMYI